MIAEDYYALLGVNAAVEREELHGAWRRLVERWHPERAGAETATTYKRMALAYAVLSDPTARAAYDRERSSVRRRSESELAASATRLAPGVRLSRLSGPLNALLARGIAKWVDDELIELALNEQEVTAGGMIVISLPVQIHCPKCLPSRRYACLHCRGRGVIDDLFSAWLAVRPDVLDGTLLAPSARLPGMLRPLYFLVRRA